MKRKKYFLLSILFLSLPLFSTKLVYTDITEEIYHDNQLYISIKAHKKVDNIEPDTITIFFNRKKYIEEHFYYEIGYIFRKSYKMNFKRMFIYGKNIYMNNVSGNFSKYTFHAKSVSVYQNRIFFRHIFFHSKNKSGSRLQFIYYFDQNNTIQ
jgi:hypothetical protein